jgi:hypothetical protein
MQQNELSEIFESIKDLQLTDEDLQGLYIFLAMNYENFTEEEKLYWNIIMEKLDPEFHNED